MNRTGIEEQKQGEQRERHHRGAESGEPGAMEAERLRAAAHNLASQLEEQIEKRPYVVIGAAAGVGFVIGSLFGSRLGQMLLAAAVGYAAKNAVEGDLGLERIGERIEKLTGERTQA